MVFMDERNRVIKVLSISRDILVNRHIINYVNKLEMTTREIYLKLLDREPDESVIREYGCMKKLSTYEQIKLKKRIKESEEYKSKNIEASEESIMKVRKAIPEIDGGGLEYRAKLIEAGIEKEEDLYVELEWEKYKRRENVSMVHVVSEYEPEKREERERIKEAMKSWEENYSDTFKPKFVKTEGGLPKIGEVIEEVIKKYELEEEVVIVYSNADIHMCRGFEEIVREYMKEKKCEACFSYRRDYYEIEGIKRREEIMEEGKWFSGVDVFIMKVRWWKENREEIGEMYIGRQYWDLVLRHRIGESEYKCQERNEGKIGRERDIWGINCHKMHYNRGCEASEEQRKNKENAREYFRKRGKDMRYIIP
jgi:hypothetical protein